MYMYFACLKQPSRAQHSQHIDKKIHQYPTCNKAGHGVKRLSFKQQIKVVIN